MNIKWMTVMRALFLSTLLFSCMGPSGDKEVTLMTLDPGHFHAALVQKEHCPGVASRVYVYAPEGLDVKGHLDKIESFNTRTENPTRWEEVVHQGPDYLEKMLEERPGDVVILSGNNGKKAQYIKACVDAGLHVLSDKPMCIDAEGYALLKEAFTTAEKKGVFLYDIMTERSEITTILQKTLSMNEAVFGKLLPGTVDEPSVVKESVHHFFKHVAGSPLTRPAWFFDTKQQGEGIVDVTTHLVDLVLWACFSGQKVHMKDVELLQARAWPTMITRAEFEQVTKNKTFPDYLTSRLNPEGVLPCFANGEMIFKVNDVHARLKVEWNYKAPEGGKDTHFSVMRGTRANIYIRQGKEQNFRPELYVEAVDPSQSVALEKALEIAVNKLRKPYPGLEIKKEGAFWHVLVPDPFRIGHEAHFRQVLERYLASLNRGWLPDWEVPNMITKYAITTGAAAMARPPEGAIVLFDGTDYSQWVCEKGGPVGWTIADGAMQVKPGTGSIHTKDPYADFKLHIEFKVPELPPLEPDARRGNRGNSGVYLQRRYEVQILDSFGFESENWDCGALYRFKKPDSNVSKKPGLWQAYDIEFRQPRFDGEGDDAKKIENARITVWHNGVLIHKDVELKDKTGQGKPEGPRPGPILLQDHGNDVAFRNIWLLPLDS